jgi:hypothetical protein
MNSRSLHALIVDQHFGELSPEVTELLETHLEQNATSRAEADRIRQTLVITEDAVLQHPELARIGIDDSAERQRNSPRRLIGASWLAKAASIALLAALAGTAGFLFGKKQENVRPTTSLAMAGATQLTPRRDSPWARYRLAPEQNGLQVVRVDTASRDNSALR